MALFIWILCGVASAGIVIADLQALDDDYRSALALGCFMAIFGPMGLPATLGLSAFARNGWTLLPRKKQ